MTEEERARRIREVKAFGRRYRALLNRYPGTPQEKLSAWTADHIPPHLNEELESLHGDVVGQRDDEWFEECKQLLAEIKRLKTENAELKRRLGVA